MLLASDDFKVSINLLLKYNLTISDYFVLFMKYHNIKNTNLVDYNVHNFNRLIESKLIIPKNLLDYEDFELTELAIQLLNDGMKVDLNTTKLWDEFKSMYPIKSGYRRLHDSPSKCKYKYYKLISSKNNIHQNIMEGLKNEKTLREKAAKVGEFFPDWKLMSTWLNSNQWEVYCNMEKDNDGGEFGKSI